MYYVVFVSRCVHVCVPAHMCVFLCMYRSCLPCRSLHFTMWEAWPRAFFLPVVPSVGHIIQHEMAPL